MAESVDASVSNTDRETCAGSTPARGTKLGKKCTERQPFAVHFFLFDATFVPIKELTPLAISLAGLTFNYVIKDSFVAGVGHDPTTSGL